MDSNIRTSQSGPCKDPQEELPASGHLHIPLKKSSILLAVAHIHVSMYLSQPTLAVTSSLHTDPLGNDCFWNRQHNSLARTPPALSEVSGPYGDFLGNP